MYIALNKKLKMKNILTFITALFILSNCQAQKQTISLNLTKGKTYTHRINLEVSTVQSVNEMDMSMKMNMGSLINYKVLNVTESFYEMEIKYADLTMKMDMRNTIQEFDSKKNDDTDILSKMMRALQKSSVLIKITKSGEVIEVKNAENFFTAIDEITSINEAEKKQMKELLSKSYGEKALKENMKMSMLNFPKQAISIGDNWIVKNTIDNGISTGIETTYELKEVTPDYYLITGISKIASLNKDTFVDQGGMQVRSDLTGTMQSTYKIDKITGWIIDGKAEQQIKGESYIKDSEMMPGGLTMPMLVTSKTIITGN